MAFQIFAIPAFFSTVAAARAVQPEGFDARPEPLVAASLEDLDLKPSPIEPSWVIAGNPEARIAEHSQSADDAAITAIWDCTAGEFRWYFGWDETVMILEGDVKVTDQNGNTRLLRKGDVAYFTGKTWATWQIDSYVKKIAFVRRPFPAPVVLAVKLKALLSRMKAGESQALRCGP